MKTPIEKGRNLGPVTGPELRTVGVPTVEELRRLGWRDVWDRWRQAYPERHHLLAGYALAGAEFDHDCMRLPASLKAEVKAHKAAGWR